MTRSPRRLTWALVLIAGMALPLWLYRIGAIGIPLVVAQDSSQIGGSWRIVYATFYLGHPSSRSRLIWELGPLVKTVASMVGEVQYLGEDCVLFEEYAAGGGYSYGVACGAWKEKTVYSGRLSAKISDRGLEVSDLVNGQLVLRRRYSVSELRALGRD
jgi:hypothetical protein